MAPSASPRVRTPSWRPVEISQASSSTFVLRPSSPRHDLAQSHNATTCNATIHRISTPPPCVCRVALLLRSAGAPACMRYMRIRAGALSIQSHRRHPQQFAMLLSLRTDHFPHAPALGRSLSHQVALIRLGQVDEVGASLCVADRLELIADVSFLSLPACLGLLRCDTQHDANAPVIVLLSYCRSKRRWADDG